MWWWQPDNFRTVRQHLGRLDEDKNDAEAQKMYDTYFPMYKMRGRNGSKCLSLGHLHDEKFSLRERRAGDCLLAQPSD